MHRINFSCRRRQRIAISKKAQGTTYCHYSRLAGNCQLTPARPAQCTHTYNNAIQTGQGQGNTAAAAETTRPAPSYTYRPCTDSAAWLVCDAMTGFRGLRRCDVARWPKLTAGSWNAGQPATTNGHLSPVRSICSCCCCQRLGGDRENMLHMIENASLEEALMVEGHMLVTMPWTACLATWLPAARPSHRSEANSSMAGKKNHAVQQKPAPV